MRKSWREVDAERKAQEHARVLFEEENKVFLSHCKTFSLVDYYKAQEAPELAPAEHKTKKVDEDPSSMMEYLGLQESDFFYG